MIRLTPGLIWILVLLSFHASLQTQAQASPDGLARGKTIYFKLCADCHGRRGEGVKGKYDEALHGNWSVEKLTQVIDRTMPEEKPELCKGPDARAVAEYIHHTFYSREARARNHPPRIELVRLTNRQYINTVADLLHQFGNPEGQAGADRGLRANYYNSRGFASDKRLIERVDPQIHFDYGQDSPLPEKIGREEFSMQWRGSVIAGESGDYVFILKTPNGTRLWVNDEETPIIDAWVASATKTEHTATLRLIGGRAYPLSLDFHKFKDKSASISLEWIPPHGTREPIPRRNLSPKKVPPTFVIRTPFPADDSSMGYERGVAITRQWDESTTKAALETAQHLAKNLNRLARVDKGTNISREKLEQFAGEFAAAAFRRPLSSEERRNYVTRHLGSTAKPEEAIKRVALHVLKSPHFLYLGVGSSAAPLTVPDAYKNAERLSYLLWDAPPDRKLLNLARDGKLGTVEEIRREARRMLADTRTRAKMQQFFHHWLQVDHVENLSKDGSLYPGFGNDIAADLRTSLNLFLDDVLWSPDSDYRKLLLSSVVFMNDRLARYYGLESVATNEFTRINWEPGRRHGILTHPYLLSVFSYARSSSPVHRGVFITRNIVGRSLKPPPMAIAFKDADFSPNMTMREKVSELTRAENCQSCHSVINPLGFSLENFDSVGRFRTRENDRPIDAASDYVTDEGTTIRLSGARDIAEFAIRDEQAQNGFVEQLFHHVVKQPMLAYGSEALPELRKSFVDSGFNIQNLLVEIATIGALPPQIRTANRENQKP